MSISKIQAELKAPKGQLNKFGNYRYRSAEDIIEAVKPLLAKYNYYLLLGDEIIAIENRIYVKATAAIMNEDNQQIARVTAWAREEEMKKGMDAAQITGSASSYARKYALNGLFAIDDTKDADATNTHQDEITEEERMYLITLLETTSYDDETKDKLAYKVNNITTKEQYQKALGSLQMNQIADKDRISMGMNYNQSDIKKAIKQK